jgi:pimeloyl-ACP methyl ester carboxylesterase
VNRSSRFQPDDCRFDVPAGRSVECGWVEVPEDRSDPEGGTVRLHVAIFASETPNPAPDPVVFLQGGPGGYALEIMPLLFEDGFSHLLADRDVIVYDQRGVGYSEPSLACPELRELGFEIIDDDLPVEETRRLQLDAVEECRDRLTASGADLAAYSSAESAADLAELREALGIDEWNLYGISYGTRLALTALRDRPEGIRSVVLDSAYPPDVDIVAEAPANLDRSLQTLFDSCAADPACAAAYPELETTFYDLLEDLEAAPLRAPVSDIFTGETYDALFDGAAFADILFGSLYLTEVIPELPRLIDEVAAGDTFRLSVLTTNLLANGAFVSTGMQFSVQCREEVAFSSPEAVTAGLADYPRLEPVFAQSPNVGPAVFDVCDLWGAGTGRPIENEPVSSPVPALVLAGEFDPITPPAWGEQAAAELGAATFVELPGAGHGPSSSIECPQALVRSFLAAPDTPLDAGCVTEMEAPAYFTPGAEPPPVELIPFTEQTFGVTLEGVVPDGWERQAPGTWARAATGLDQTAIIQQPVPGVPAETVLGLLGPQFGIDEGGEPTDSYESPAGAWSLYEGSIVGAPVTVALLETDIGSVLVVLVSNPAEQDRLRADVLFPALDALTVS